MTPLASIVAVTKNRRHFIPQLLRQFAKQDYPAKELIVVASGEPIDDLLPSRDSQIKLIRHEGSIGECRNVAVEAASGEFCIQFDDDDWQAFDRVSAQVTHLQMTRKAVVGMFEIVFYAGGPNAWRVIDRIEHCAGAAMAYRRDYALQNPFSAEPSPFAEDTDFVTRAIKQEQFSNITGLDVLVMNTHGANDSGRVMLPDELLELSDNWRKVPVERIEHILHG